NPENLLCRALVWHGAMLTTCPNCLHVFHNNRVVQQFTTPSSTSTTCCDYNRQQQQQPLLVSLTIPPTSVPTTCTVSVTTSPGCQQHLNTNQRVLAGMAGGGIILNNINNNNPSSSVILQQTTQDDKIVIPSCSPQPSPSTPLSFVLPSIRTSNTLPFQWNIPATTASATAASNQQLPWVLGLQLPQTQTIPQVPQSDTDLVRLAATLKALRNSGWYYEGLSWQESAEALQSTTPGTFLVRDSSDPKFLFSLSVQTERGPTSVRLHYVCGQFRLDAETRLAPQMPLFDCVVQLVEYYIEATKDSAKASVTDGENLKGSKGSHARHKEQVWVDANGHMYSHILLTTPLYKKQHLPSLQHLARLAINKSLKASMPKKLSTRNSLSVSQLPLPTLLTDYLKEYPYSH
ncbi:hypothetical protein L9F63_023642, partial [Diploptera punctata]